MTEFRQHLAPLSNAAWGVIQEHARSVLGKQLAGRRVVDVKGPLGLQFHAVGTGRLTSCPMEGFADAKIGVRQVVPVMEVRKTFQLRLDEFDALARGAEDIDLDPLTETAKQLATLEDSVIFNGLATAGIEGMIQAATLEPQQLGSDPARFMEDLATAVARLRSETVEGSPKDSFHLVLSPDLRRFTNGEFIGSHSLRQEILKLIGGQIYTSNALDSGVLVNTNGGNFELTLAQDFTLGYEHYTAETVTLFLMEAFTFRVLNGEASLLLKS